VRMPAKCKEGGGGSGGFKGIPSWSACIPLAQLVARSLLFVMFVCEYNCVCVCMCVCVYMCGFVYVFLKVRICVCVCVCICVDLCMYV
jgi:hypothetical protein